MNSKTTEIYKHIFFGFIIKKVSDICLIIKEKETKLLLSIGSGFIPVEDIDFIDHTHQKMILDFLKIDLGKNNSFLAREIIELFSNKINETTKEKIFDAVVLDIGFHNLKFRTHITLTTEKKIISLRAIANNPPVINKVNVKTEVEIWLDDFFNIDKLDIFNVKNHRDKKIII